MAAAAPSQGSSTLKMPASDPPSPSSDGAKSSRVCLNCRRKKKKCDKKLPSCGRCTYSLEYCQHEDDPSIVSERNLRAQSSYTVPMLASLGSQEPFPVDPFLDRRIGSLLSLSPAVFQSLDTSEDIHQFVFRSLSQIAGDRSGIESIVRYYFETVNTWFTIVERTNFDDRLEQIWSEPSAEMGLLVLCMLLIVRMPEDTPSFSMQNSFYYSVKTVFALVETKIPMSTTLLQGNLLIALYEVSHLMPQQAFMTVGACVQVTRAFGWHDGSFWAEDRQALYPAELKRFSLLWWAIVFVDSSLHVEDHGYPLSIEGLDFAIPLPEFFDQYLQPSTGDLYGRHEREGLFRFADDWSDRIDTVVWPEAKSSSLLVQVLQRSRHTTIQRVPREDLSNAIMAHARHLVSQPWKHGNRCAALSVAYIALLKLYYPQFPNGHYSVSSFDATDRRAMEDVTPVLASVVNIAQVTSSNVTSFPYPDPLIPVCSYCMYLAAIMFITIGDGILRDAGWTGKVQILLQCLEVYGKRWTVARKYMNAINIALQTRLSPTHV